MLATIDIKGTYADMQKTIDALNYVIDKPSTPLHITMPLINLKCVCEMLQMQMPKEDDNA